jgi:hypothetical protein
VNRSERFLSPFYIFISMMLTILLYGCNTTSSLSNDPNFDASKAADVDNSLKKGNITKAFNRMTDAPNCPDCVKKAARARARSAKTGSYHQIAEIANMSCLKADRAVSLKSLNVRVGGVPSNKEAVVSKLAGTLERLGGRGAAKRLIGGMEVEVFNVLGKRSDGLCSPGNQLDIIIKLAQKCPNGSKIPFTEAVLIHEIGHFAANKAKLYGPYRQSDKRPHRNRNEEFAEVFSSYLTTPKLLKKRCPEAYTFMREEVLTKQDHKCR